MTSFMSAMLPCFVCFVFLAMPPKKAAKAKETASQKRKRAEEERCEKEAKKKQQALMKTSLGKQAATNPDSAALLELYESLDRFSEEKSVLLQRWLQELQ